METVVGFLGILREALKILCNNGRIVTPVALFTVLTLSALYLSTIFSITPALKDLLIEESSLRNATPGTQEFTDIVKHIKKDFEIIFGFECFYIILDSITFLLSTTATILAAAIIYCGKQEYLSLKDLVLRTARTWRRPLVTWLYITLLGLVFFVVSSAILFGLVLMIKNPATLVVAASILGVSAMVLYMYLSVAWNLAIVISAVEETRGVEAVRKASQLVKGMKLQGFLLNLLFNVSSLVLVQGINVMSKAQPLAIQIIVALVVIICIGLESMYWFAAFTVFYYRCKKTYGERVKFLMEGSLDGYRKIPTTTTIPVIGDNIP